MRPFVTLLIYDNLIITITIMTVGDSNGLTMMIMHEKGKRAKKNGNDN